MIHGIHNPGTSALRSQHEPQIMWNEIGSNDRFAPIGERLPFSTEDTLPTDNRGSVNFPIARSFFEDPSLNRSNHDDEARPKSQVPQLGRTKSSNTIANKTCPRSHRIAIKQKISIATIFSENKEPKNTRLPALRWSQGGPKKPQTAPSMEYPTSSLSFFAL